MKGRILLCLLLCCALLLPVLAACNGSTGDPTGTPGGDPTATPPDSGSNGTKDDGAIYTVDFTDGNLDFLRLNTAPRKADPNATMEIKEIEGVKALAITAPGGGETHLGISIDGLLGGKAADVKTIQLEIFVENPDGWQRALRGELVASSGADMTEIGRGPWAARPEQRNPEPEVRLILDDGMSFSSGGPNMFELLCTTNEAAERGDTPAIMYIMSITFFDDSGDGMEVDTTASWAGPEDYGMGGGASIGRYDLPIADNTIDGNFFEFYTWGPGDDGGMSGPDDKNVAGVDDYLPWEVISKSIGIVIEMPEEPSAPIVVIHFGEYSGWDWSGGQNDDARAVWDNGKATIMWDDMDKAFNVKSVTEEDAILKLRVGSWSENIPSMATAVYLLIEGEDGGGSAAEHDLPIADNTIDGNFFEFYTWGPGDDGGMSGPDDKNVAGVDDYLPWDVISKSIGIVLEMTEEPSAPIVVIHFGEYSGWDWSGGQNDDAHAVWENGKATIYWDDLDKKFNVRSVTEEDAILKLRIGSWSENIPSMTTRVYLLMG